MIIKESASYF